MKKLLVPIDFTTASRTASEYAASIAQRFSAKIFLLHVYIEPTPATEVQSAWIITGQELHNMYDSQIKEEVQYLSVKYNINVTGSATIGYRGDTILNTAKDIGADVIVMGMKSIRNKILGSTTLTTIRKSHIPVLIIPEGVAFNPIKNIVFASDFDTVENKDCFDLLFTIMDKFKAGLKLLHVQKKGSEVMAKEVPGRMQIGRTFSRVPLLKIEEIEDESVTHGIQSFIQNHPTNLLVMIAHHHNVFERLLNTIHTRSMSYETNVPLLILVDK